MVSFARASWHAAPMLLAWASLAWGAGPDLSPYQDSLKARHFEEVERLAHERLQSTPHDVSAMLAEAIAIIDMLDSARYANAEANLNACISGDPSAAICQTWLGRVLALQVTGLTSGMRLASRIRAAFARAVELDPGNLDVRSDLVAYDLEAPAVVGGGLDRAKAEVESFTRLKPDEAPLLNAYIDLHAARYVDVERIVLAAGAANDNIVAGVHRDLLGQLGEAYIKAKHSADARRVFAYLRTCYPDTLEAWYGLGSVSLDEGKFDEAIADLEHATRLGPDAAPYYRLGQAWEGKGDKKRALDSYAKALRAMPGLKTELRDDAQRRVHTLEG